MPQMIIANRLADGLVVFFAPGEEWTPAIASGRVIEDEAEAAQLLEAAKRDQARNVVLDPMLIQVKVENGEVRPTEIREVIRAFGPTVRTDVEEGQPVVSIAPEADRRAEGVARLRRTTKE